MLQAFLEVPTIAFLEIENFRTRWVSVVKTLIRTYDVSSADQKIGFEHNWALFVLLVLLTFHAGFRGVYNDYDSLSYKYFFDHLSFMSFGEYLNGFNADSIYYSIRFYNYEIGFATLTYFLSLTGMSSVLYFCSISFLSLSLKILAIRKYSLNPYVCLAWYLSWYYVVLELNAIRAGIASGILLLGLGALLNNKNLHFYLIVILASLFHIASLIALLFPIVISDKIKSLHLSIMLFASFLPIVILKYFSYNYLLSFNSKLLAYGIQRIESGLYSDINIFNVTLFLRVALFIIIVLNWNKCINTFKHASKFIKLYVFSISIYISLSFLPVVSGRLSELIGVFQIFIISILFKSFPTSKYIRLFVFLTIIYQFYSVVFRSPLANVFYFMGFNDPRYIGIQ